MIRWCKYTTFANSNEECQEYKLRIPTLPTWPHSYCCPLTILELHLEAAHKNKTFEDYAKFWNACLEPKNKKNLFLSLQGTRMDKEQSVGVCLYNSITMKQWGS